MAERVLETTINAVVQIILMSLLAWGIWKAKQRHEAAKKRTSPAVLVLVGLLGAVALSLAIVWTMQQ
jgi:hypothetical protein